jgi:hypothetical protein
MPWLVTRYDKVIAIAVIIAAFRTSLPERSRLILVQNLTPKV